MKSFSEIGSIVSFYIAAKQQVVAAGFAEEILAQESTDLEVLTESAFLRETAWVILCAGMSERVVRMKFGSLAAAFMEFRSSEEIALHSSECYRRALEIFRHSGKIRAIVRAAHQIAKCGFADFRAQLDDNPIRVLAAFDYIGPVTVRHLAKNIGIVTAKEDRHLTRLAHRAGFRDASSLCSAISTYIGERVDVVDTVLWRYAVLNGSAMLHEHAAIPQRLSN